MAQAKRRALLALTTILAALLAATLLASGGSDSTQHGPIASEICVTALGRDWVCIDIL